MRYAVLLAQVRNFSQVAKQLGITQPSLSKQILALEKDLDIKLFDRETNPLSLTPAGEFFIKEAKELLYKEDQLVKTLSEFKTGKLGHLSIGISPFRSQYLIPEIVRKIKNKFPGTKVVVHEEGSDIIRAGAAEGKYDFAVVNLPVDESMLNVIPLESDKLVLAIRNDLLHTLPKYDDAKQLDFSNCSDVPFIVLGEGQEMRQLFDTLCADANITPNIAAEVVGLSTALSMVEAGVGAALLPLQLIKGRRQLADICCMSLKNETYIRQPVIVTRKDQYISEQTKYAIELLKNNRLIEE